MSNAERTAAIYPKSPQQRYAEEFVSSWKPVCPDYPWETISQVLLAVTQYHPEIILLTADRVRDIACEHGIQMDADTDTGIVSGVVNPGIVTIRAEVMRSSYFLP